MYFRRALSIVVIVVLLLGNLSGQTNSRSLAIFTDVAAVSAGGDHTVVVDSNGFVWAWGRNHFGQLGDGTIVDRYGPIQVLSADGYFGNIRSVSAGSGFTMAIDNSGGLWAWGINAFGQLGLVGLESCKLPVRVPGIRDVRSVSAGSGHVLAIKEDGTVWSWGDNRYGQLGNGTTVTSVSPRQVPGLANVIAVAAGPGFSMALTGAGEVYTWGSNAYYQLGDGTTEDRLTPGMVPGLVDITAIAAGGMHGVALDRFGSVWGWGRNIYQQIDGGQSAVYSVPQPIAEGVSSIDASMLYTLAVQDDGTILASGYFMGLFYEGYELSARKVPGLTAVSAGYSHLVLIQGQDVSVWGSNGGTSLAIFDARPVTALGSVEIIQVPGRGWNVGAPIEIVFDDVVFPGKNFSGITVGAGGREVELDAYNYGNRIRILPVGGRWDANTTYTVTVPRFAVTGNALGGHYSSGREFKFRTGRGSASVLKSNEFTGKVTIPPEVTVGVGQVLQLFDGAGDGLVWRSDNPGVVSVNNTGRLTGLTAGKAIISVYSDGQNLGSCTVTVVPRGRVQPQVAKVLFTQSKVAINPAELGVSAAQLRQEVADVIAGIEGIPLGFGIATNTTGPVGISLILPGIVMHESMLDTQRRKVLVQERAAEIVNRLVGAGMTELERELVLYDYLVDNTKYDLQNFKADAIPAGSASVYGVLINGVGVCDGYARAFQYLMHQVGIECMYVLGDEMYHAWNMVKIDGRYYHVDVTWSTPGNRYAYFNLTDEEMGRGYSLGGE